MKEEQRIRFTVDVLAIILGMMNRGDNQHDIAAWFGTNGGRIGEVASVLNGDRSPIDKDGRPYPFPDPVPDEDLLPRGAPGPKGLRLLDAVERAMTALDDGDAKTARAFLSAARKAFLDRD